MIKQKWNLIKYIQYTKERNDWIQDKSMYGKKKNSIKTEKKYQNNKLLFSKNEKVPNNYL